MCSLLDTVRCIRDAVREVARSGARLLRGGRPASAPGAARRWPPRCWRSSSSCRARAWCTARRPASARRARARLSLCRASGPGEPGGGCRTRLLPAAPACSRQAALTRRRRTLGRVAYGRCACVLLVAGGSTRAAGARATACRLTRGAAARWATWRTCAAWACGAPAPHSRTLRCGPHPPSNTTRRLTPAGRWPQSSPASRVLSCCLWERMRTSYAACWVEKCRHRPLSANQLCGRIAAWLQRSSQSR